MNLPQHGYIDVNATQLVQMENSCFANILLKDAYVNVMHVMQMFEPILMEVQKFIAEFFVQK